MDELPVVLLVLVSGTDGPCVNHNRAHWESGPRSGQWPTQRKFCAGVQIGTASITLGPARVSTTRRMQQCPVLRCSPLASAQ